LSADDGGGSRWCPVSISIRVAKCRIEDGFPGFRLAIPLYSSVLHSLFRFAIDGAFFCFYRECSCGKKQANYKSLEGQVWLLLSVFQDLHVFWFGSLLFSSTAPAPSRPVHTTSNPRPAQNADRQPFPPLGTLRLKMAAHRVSTPRSMPSSPVNTHASTLSMHVEHPKDERISNLEAKLFQLTTRLGQQNNDIKNLRAMNATLLTAALESDKAKHEATLKTKKYKTVAIKMKKKIHALQDKLLDEKHSTNEQMSFAVHQTKSLLERLFVADARRRDLEGRFGTLARPSTKLRVEIDRSWQHQTNNQDREEDRNRGKDGSGDGPRVCSKEHRVYGNVPPSIVVAPTNLLDRSFTPAEPVMQNTKKHRQHSRPSPRTVNVVNVPQKFVNEDEILSMLSSEEKNLLAQLSSHVTGAGVR